MDQQLDRSSDGWMDCLAERKKEEERGNKHEHKKHGGNNFSDGQFFFLVVKNVISSFCGSSDEVEISLISLPIITLEGKKQVIPIQ